MTILGVLKPDVEYRWVSGNWHTNARILLIKLEPKPEPVATKMNCPAVLQKAPTSQRSRWVHSVTRFSEPKAVCQDSCITQSTFSHTLNLYTF